MQRRRFLTSAAATGLGLALPSSAQTTDQVAAAHSAPQPTPSALPVDLFGPAAEDSYFSEQKLHAALGTDRLQRGEDIVTLAYNFPSWHPSPWMEAHFGKGWTEFDSLRNSRTLFPGHTMPHYPLWGYYDEADPAWAAREIDLAADYGLDAWMIDWYWHDGTQLYHEQLERGFLQAPNRNRLRFAIMWANHDWKNVYPARSPGDAAIILPQRHSLADFERVANYWAEHYLHEPTYLRVGGRPLISIFDGGKLIEELGSPDAAKRALALVRKRCHTLGIGDIHLQTAGGYGTILPTLGELGFDSVTQYGTFGWTYGSKPPGSRIPYGSGCAEAIGSWKQMYAASPIPFHPSVQVGWDDSPRFEEFASVAINRSPDQFERLLRAARHMVATQPSSKATARPSEKLILIAAWNEWTEDHVLLPDTTWGFSYVEALRRATRS